MNQEKIGKLIAECRKEKGYTQRTLADELGITDRAISKWENGRSMPDSSIMLELCKLLGISVNELLTGERLDMDNYKEIAESNLLELAKKEEQNNKRLLRLETVIGYISSISFIIMIFAASYAVENTWWRIALIVIGFIIFVIGMTFCLKIEHDAGYYECQNCHEKYVPSMKSVVLASHIGRSRRLKCPYCGKRNYHKKVLKK